jgi:hypothetical protein
MIVSPCRPRHVSGVRALKRFGFWVHLASSTMLRLGYGSVTNRRSQPYVATLYRTEFLAGLRQRKLRAVSLGRQLLVALNRCQIACGGWTEMRSEVT